jgi:hypothetical protein
MTTTTDYAPNVDATGGTTTAVPELFDAFESVQALIANFQAVPALTTATEAHRARMRAQLAALSVDPDSLDRDSETDIWGFHGN